MNDPSVIDDLLPPPPPSPYVLTMKDRRACWTHSIETRRRSVSRLARRRRVQAAGAIGGRISLGRPVARAKPRTSTRWTACRCSTTFRRTPGLPVEKAMTRPCSRRGNGSASATRQPRRVRRRVRGGRAQGNVTNTGTNTTPAEVATLRRRVVLNSSTAPISSTGIIVRTGLSKA